MNQKEVTSVLYEKINGAGRIETIFENGKTFFIYKSATEEKYMVCELNEDTENTHSDVFRTIIDCYNWVELNKKRYL
jgi:hypothetical protein